MTFLYISRYTVSDGEQREDIRDAHQEGYETTRTSCGIPRHHPARRTVAELRIFDRARLWEAVPEVFPIMTYLDCPCDAGCPRCDSPATMGCRTLDGGGRSGGGLSCNWHAVRIKASPRCQGVLNGTRMACDWGWHPWRNTRDGHAECLWCKTREPLHDAGWEEIETERRQWMAGQIAAARTEVERRAGVVHLADRRHAKEETG